MFDKVVGFAISFFVLMGIVLLVGCSSDKKDKLPSDAPADQVNELRLLFDVVKGEAEKQRDPTNGWITPTDCDGMIWSGKYASAVCGEVKIEASEFDSSGRFGRRPPPRCWTEEAGDQGSKTTWSRDMAVGGFIPWAWRCKNLPVLERHSQFGKDNNWKMGEPFADGRVLYSPQVVGLVYQAIFGLGGDDSVNRLWPSLYPGGLDDFEAHLQMMTIWLRSEMEPTRFTETPISKLMLERITEHADREPRNPLYQYMRGLYDGNMDPAIALLLDPERPVGEYVRCAVPETCRNAEWLFAASLVLERFP